MADAHGDLGLGYEWDIEEDTEGAPHVGYNETIGPETMHVDEAGWDSYNYNDTEPMEAFEPDAASFDEAGWCSYDYDGAGPMEVNRTEVDVGFNQADTLEPTWSADYRWGLHQRNYGFGPMDTDYAAGNIGISEGAPGESNEGTHVTGTNTPPEPSSDPIPLFNPFGNAAAPAYIKIESPEGVTYRHASAGAIVQEAGREKTLWQKMREENIIKHGGCRWGRWKTQREWEDAHWMATTKSSQGTLEELLQTDRVSGITV
jgi:hypothetical protein